MNPKSFAAAPVLFLVFALVGSPLRADIVACPSGNFSSVDYTTCDIGNLQFTFTGLVSMTSPSGTPAWTDSDFTFTVLSNGFELSGPPAQTITAPIGPEVYYDAAYFNYNVTDLAGLITGVDVSGGNLSASGPGSVVITDASNYIFLENESASEVVSALNIVSDVNGIIYTQLGSKYAFGGPISSGFGEAEPFVLEAGPGDTASIDSTATYFTFTEEPPAPSPEPRTWTLLGAGFLALLCGHRAALRRRMPCNL